MLVFVPVVVVVVVAVAVVWLLWMLLLLTKVILEAHLQDSFSETINPESLEVTKTKGFLKGT